MDLHTATSYKISRLTTLAYSSSFGLSSLLFAKALRPHIYAVYGLVRNADEIVDTYTGTDAHRLLDQLEQAVYAALDRGYDPNPIVHAFAVTAQHYGIDQRLIEPFFSSMRIDLAPHTYDQKLYHQYIHGSAEVVGLMCLRIFCQGNTTRYNQLKDGAAALGSAYQKVNFLRDLADDYQRLGRLYFPDVAFDTFNDTDKQAIIRDIRRDFRRAHAALVTLPRSSRLAVLTSYVYYTKLLALLERTPAEQIKRTRLRVPDGYKLLFLAKVVATEGWKQ